MKIGLAQQNPLVGDVNGNVARVLETVARARAAGLDLVAFPEQTILGYPAKDLLMRRDVVAANVSAVERIAAASDGIGIVVGYAEPNDETPGRHLWNTALLFENGRRLGRWRKRLLPTYDVFDESRYFEPAGGQPPIVFRGKRIGLSVCEDLLFDEAILGWPRYDCDPLVELTALGVDLHLNISASPYAVAKPAWRAGRFAEVARRAGVPLLYVNQVGGNDDLVFDGGSCAVDATGRCFARSPNFVEDLLIVDLDDPDGGSVAPDRGQMDNMHDALVLGLRDYVRKCGFESAVIGLSGGIDSAVVAGLAVRALGADQVLGVGMPSRYSSDHSRSDAADLAERLGIAYREIAIEPMHAAFGASLATTFGDSPAGVTDENIQARTRGTLLMALSNELGHLLLTTGNKSELAVGYCTLYGDMCGGLAVISDVPKTQVYALGRYINQRAAAEGRQPPIPESTLTKPPSAELRPDQHDQQSLPPYDVLDEILERYEERLEGRAEIVAAGFEPAIVDRVLRLIHISEYKRQQAAPGIKVTSRAFGSGRRVPIAKRDLQG